MVFWARWALLFFCLVACSWASENELAKKARQLYYSDKFNEALVMVDKALEKNPTSPEPYLVSATILAHRRDFDSMRSLVKKVRTKWPQAVEGNLIEADLLFLTGKGAKARRLLDKTSKSHASDLTVQLNRIILLAATGEASKARKLLEKSLLKKKLEAAEEILNVCAALVILPGGSEKALALLRKCRKLHGESSQVLLLEGMVYMREASWGRAVAVLLQGLERNPEKLSEMLMLAPLLSGLGHSKEVENILNEARKIFPHSAELKRLLIQVKARAADEKQLVVHKFDGIVLHVPPQLPKKHLESVIVQIKRSLATVEKFFGVSGSPVKLKLLSSTGVS